jgi:hypothetical protein
MMLPFDTNLLKYRAQHLQLPTQAERSARSLNKMQRPIYWQVMSWLGALANRYARRFKRASRERTFF